MQIIFPISKQLLQEVFNVLSSIDSGKVVSHNNRNYVVAQIFLQVLSFMKFDSPELDKDLIEMIILTIGRLPCETSVSNSNGRQMCDLYHELRTIYYSVIGEAYYGTNVQADNDRDSLDLTDA